jgi:hypothetical protein
MVSVHRAKATSVLGDSFPRIDDDIDRWINVYPAVDDLRRYNHPLLWEHPACCGNHRRRVSHLGDCDADLLTHAHRRAYHEAAVDLIGMISRGFLK